MGTHWAKVQSEWEHKVDTTKRKTKAKQSTKIKWRLYTKRTHGYKMQITDDKEDLRWKI
jgi:hypothetical protein